jgi:hypothetical protein
MLSSFKLQTAATYWVVVDMVSRHMMARIEAVAQCCRQAQAQARVVLVLVKPREGLGACAAPLQGLQLFLGVAHVGEVSCFRSLGSVSCVTHGVITA